MVELNHGGRLREAAKRYDIPLHNWLDLSTGINPCGWAVPPLPASCWQRLPETGDGLEQAAADYYGSHELLPVAGSQAALQGLPRLCRRSRIGLLQTSYAEHARAWRQLGHEVVELQVTDIEAALPQLDVLLLVNPNNPTGVQFSRKQLLDWHHSLASHDGWLVVDEAFIDVHPEHSLVSEARRQGLIVLRSLGKFFGLAGVRVGFLFACPRLRQQLLELLGPWAVSNPAREVARQALSDFAWHATTRRQLHQASDRMAELLTSAGLNSSGNTALFHYCRTGEAAALHHALASQGVLTRLFEVPAAVRFGLPGDEPEWQRLEQALTLAMHNKGVEVALC